MNQPPSLPLTAVGAFVLAASVLAACASSRSLSDLPAREVTGHYTSGPDGQWFRPCSATDEDAAWWVTFTNRAVEQREAAPYAGLLQSEGPVFVRWRAALGDRAVGDPTGPGPGARYALVREIVEVRPVAAGDCAAP